MMVTSALQNHRPKFLESRLDYFQSIFGKFKCKEFRTREPARFGGIAGGEEFAADLAT